MHTVLMMLKKRFRELVPRHEQMVKRAAVYLAEEGNESEHPVSLTRCSVGLRRDTLVSEFKGSCPPVAGL